MTEPSDLPEHAEVVVVGSGFAGIAMAVRLADAGFADVVVLERAQDVGGTWRDNTYPGAACDVPSRLYSLSFAARHSWTRTFSAQPEIQGYLRSVADRYGVRRRVVFGCELQAATWDDDDRVWRLQTSRGDVTADVLVGATGSLSDPAVPELPGLDGFEGSVFHSARWDHEHDLSGERVAVVGTGASAVQIVPRIQPVVGRLTVFQRSPAWVVPKGDRPFRRWERALYRVPLARTVARALIYVGREWLVVPFVRRPQLLPVLEKAARQHLADQVADPALRATLTPSYRLGCKRVLPSNDFYPAVSQPNVEVVPAAVAEVRAHSVLDAAGGEHEVDTIVFATGFQVRDLPIGHLVKGRDGRTLMDHWRGSPHAFLGTTVPGFPNFFLLMGPNTGTGHTSQVVMIEAQIRHAMRVLTAMRRDAVRTAEVAPEVEERFAADVDRRMKGTVWTTGGCGSWYLDQTGRNSALWPGSTIRFRRLTARFRRGDYVGGR